MSNSVNSTRVYAKVVAEAEARREQLAARYADFIMETDYEVERAEELGRKAKRKLYMPAQGKVVCDGEEISYKTKEDVELYLKINKDRICNGQWNTKDSDGNKNKMMQIDMTLYCKTNKKDGIDDEIVQSIDWITEMLGKEHFITLRNFPNYRVYKSCVKHGIVVDGVLYGFMGATVSQGRVYEGLWTSYKDIEKVREIYSYFSPSLKNQSVKKSQIAKLESRVFMSKSSGVNVGYCQPHYTNNEYADFKFVVIDDIYHNGINVTDGSGLLNENAAKFISEKLGEKTVSFQIRPFKGIISSVSNANVIKAIDYHNNNCREEDKVIYNAKDVTEGNMLVISKSQYKYVMGMDLFPLTILNFAHKCEKDDLVRTTYSIPNNLKLSEKDIDTLIDETIENVSFDKNDEPHILARKLNVFARKEDFMDSFALDRNEYRSDLQTFTKLAKINAYAAVQSPYLVRKLNSQYKQQIAEMAAGKFAIKGSFDLIIMDPAVFWGELSLAPNEFYSGIEDGRTSIIRFPFINGGEAQNINCVANEELDKMFKGYNIIVFNKYDNLQELLQGADFDGDKVLRSKNKTIVNAIEKLMAANQLRFMEKVNMEFAAKTNDKMNEIVEYNLDSAMEHYLRLYKLGHPEGEQAPTVGILTNIATVITDRLTKDELLMDENCYTLCYLALMVGQVIDAAKTGVNPDVDMSYFDKLKDGIPSFARRVRVDLNRFVWNELEEGRHYKSNSPLGKKEDEIREIYENFLKTEEIDGGAIEDLIESTLGMSGGGNPDRANEKGLMGHIDEKCYMVVTEIVEAHNNTIKECRRIFNDIAKDISDDTECRKLMRVIYDMAVKETSRLIHEFIDAQVGVKDLGLKMAAAMFDLYPDKAITFQIDDGDFIGELFKRMPAPNMTQVTEYVYNNCTGYKYHDGARYYILKRNKFNDEVAVSDEYKFRASVIVKAQMEIKDTEELQDMPVYGEYKRLAGKKVIVIYVLDNAMGTYKPIGILKDRLLDDQELALMCKRLCVSSIPSGKTDKGGELVTELTLILSK